jgi:hypothetical protein
VLFRPGGSQILDSRGDLVCMVVPEGQFSEQISLSLLARCFWLVLPVSCGSGIGSWVT